MITQQLLDYIRQQQTAGKSMDEIKIMLQQAGWQEADIQEGLTAAQAGQTTAPAGPAGELPSASSILKEAWQTYKSRLWTYVGMSAIPIVTLLILMGIFGATGFLTGQGQPAGGSAAGITILIVAFVAFIFFIYFMVWATASALVLVRDRVEGIGIKEAFIRGRPLINPFFTTALLAGLAIMGGFILLIVPGIIFWLWFSQSAYVAVGEGLKNKAALSQSKSYVKGRMGSVFLKLFFIGFITWLISFVVAIPFAATEQTIMAGNIVSQVVNVFWTPVVTIYGWLLYEHLKRTKAS